MSTLATPEVQAIRADTEREVIRRLSNRTHNLKIMGQRVVIWKHSLTDKDKRAKLLTLAAQLKVSSARASVAVSSAEQAIFEVRTVNTVSNSLVPSDKVKVC
jgi:hypothetical protein